MQKFQTGQFKITDHIGDIKSALFRVFIFALVAAIAIIDFRVSQQISFSLLYLIPIALSAGWFRLRFSFIVMAVTVCSGLIIGLISDQYDWMWAPYVNALLRSTAYAFLILMQDRLRTEAAFARTDALTGLLNRRAFWEVMGEEVARCKRYHRPVSIAYIDVDGFKNINDKYGHHTGDRFLKTLAKTLRKSARITDRIARLGGDEFAVLMPETDENGVQFVLKRLSQLAQLMDKHLFSITVSIGAATFIKPPVNVEELVSAADKQMYQCKQKGKNCIEAAVIR